MINYTYEVQVAVNPITGEKNVTILRSDSALIPFDESNSDYQRYLIDTDGGLPMPGGEATA